MVPFKLPPWKHKLIDTQIKTKDMLVSRYTRHMEMVMKEAVNYIWEHYEKTGRYVVPSLHAMDRVSENFYRDVLTHAYDSSVSEKKAQHSNGETPNVGLRHLSRWPIGIPKSLRSLEKIFRDKRYWPMIMKRSQLITDRIRRLYLKKLQVRFDKIIPDLNAGTITPIEAKAKLSEAWAVTESRIEMIFRTESSTYFSKTQVAFFSGDKDIIGFLFDSIRDIARTPWCRSRHGLIYRPGTKELTDNIPPVHHNCRSHLIPLANTQHNREMLADPRRDPEKVKVVPLPAGWSRSK